MAWYRTYRPKKIADLNITSVRESLQRMMADGKLPQSLLFAGPKGTGKTSASRILGAMLNDPANEMLIEQLFFANQQDASKTTPTPKPKSKLAFVEPDADSDFANRVYEGHSFVVQELDAASNRRIDDIRLLKERINLPPTEGKMTVYILDEVHMLTTEAFNALLKMLEEPPAHVVFILATTELHKIPATIISRCSVINFRKATTDELKQALSRVLQAEQIKYEDEDLSKIAKRADGSFRDGVKILEMACQDGQLDLKNVQSLLASDNEVYIKNLLELVIQKDELELVKVFEELRANNYNQKDFYKDLFELLHQDLLRNLSVVEGQAIFAGKIDQFFLKEILSIDLNQETPVHFLVLELKFLEIIERSKKTVNSGEKPLAATVASDSKKKILKIDPTQDQQSTWQKLIKTFAGENFSLLTLLKSCKLDNLQDNLATVSVYHSFHKEQLEQNKNRELLSKAALEVFGFDLQFDFILHTQEAQTLTKGSDSELMLAVKDSLL